MLDKAFMSAVVLLRSFWAASEPAARTALSVDILDQLSQLQFCRLRITSFIELLKEALSLAATQREVCIPWLRIQPPTSHSRKNSMGMQAAVELLERMPCYSDLASPAGPPFGEGTCRWEVDTVLAAEMQMRMALLGTCTAQLPQVGDCPESCMLPAYCCVS